MRLAWCVGSCSIVAAVLLAATAPAHAEDAPAREAAPTATRPEGAAAPEKPTPPERTDDRETAEPAPPPEQTFSPTERIPAGGDVSYPVDI